MEAIGTLAGGIAHDFNNMLGMILGFTEIALLDLPQGSRSSTSLHKALRATHRAKDLVKQIVAFSRPVDQERKLIDISPVTRESLKLMRASLPTTIEIRENITSSGVILGEPSEIQQLIMNLCTNAYHAMRGRVGFLDVSLCDIDFKTIQTLDYKDLSPGKYVRLTVSDTGCGIDPAIRDRIYDPYFTTKPIGEGSGLGLSIVHGIVTNYGGSIKVDSTPGQGTTFDIYLPTVAREFSESGPEADQAAPTGSGTVLYVDDEASLVEVGKLMLELLGYRVVAATNSMEALKIFMERPEEFDAVVTDMTMPNMTGVELARKVMEVRPEIPIILCTGYSDLINKEKAKDLGIKGFVMKPFNLLGLGTMLKHVLGANVQG
jgi:CheY-like chemotaxis protein